MRRVCWQIGIVPLITLLLTLTLAGCGEKDTVTPNPTQDSVAVVAPPSIPTSDQAILGILPTPTPRQHPPTPTLVPTSPPPPTSTPLVPTSTREAEATGEKDETKIDETATPPPTETPTPEPVSSEMALVPAGEFLMGTTHEDESPPHAVTVESFEIDKFEVTNEEFQRFADETGYQTEGEQAGDGDNWLAYAEGKPRHPVVKVTWRDAQAYCEWAGKRLPAETEWEKAARGTEQLIYPWGNEWDPDRANTKTSGFRGTTVVGSFPQGASPYGLMDMAGNVAEWTSDWYKAYPGSGFSSPYYGEKYRVIRGGAWFTQQELVRTTERSASSEELRNDDVGIRCARSAG